jgi:hypothetical protein
MTRPREALNVWCSHVCMGDTMGYSRGGFNGEESVANPE